MKERSPTVPPPPKDESVIKAPKGPLPAGLKTPPPDGKDRAVDPKPTIRPFKVNSR